MEKKFQLMVGSPIEYEELVVYILINGEVIALLQKDEGIDHIRVEFFEDPIQTTIYYDILIEALQAAKAELIR